MADRPASILDIAVFNRRFDDVLPLYNTYQEAYEAIEAEVISLFNHRKYSDYESFRSSRSRWLSRKKGNPGNICRRI